MSALWSRLPAFLTTLASITPRPRLGVMLVVLAWVLALPWLGDGKGLSTVSVLVTADNTASTTADRWPDQSRPTGLVRPGRGPVLGAGTAPPKALVVARAHVVAATIALRPAGRGAAHFQDGHPAANGQGSRRVPTGPPGGPTFPL